METQQQLTIDIQQEFETINQQLSNLFSVLSNSNSFLFLEEELDMVADLINYRNSLKNIVDRAIILADK